MCYLNLSSEVKLNSNNKQLTLFQQELPHDVKNWGTFKDSLKAPVHRWFTYPAGFSFKAVEHSFARFFITEGMTVYDPFMGSGTTNLTAKSKGISSIGVEAHSFVYEITKAKMEWDIDKKKIQKFISYLNSNFHNKLNSLSDNKNFSLSHYFPELVVKCYSEETLKKLLTIRELYNGYVFENKEKNFFFVVITALLRNISSAATGWPYIAPKKVKITSSDKDALQEFNTLALSMLQDLEDIKFFSDVDYKKSNHKLILGSSVDVSIDNESIDHVFTSPPYLNNFDYSDRTRLELYFWGIAKNWKDISDKIRTKLITSATTQIQRSNPKYKIDNEFKSKCPEVTKFIQDSANKLSELRKVKGGKKSYDLMLIGYFNDMYKIITEVYRVLKKDTKALFVLGDSAPYGVYIPTDKLIGEIGCAIGFDSYSLEILRKRGDKWKGNPQRHHVSLRESIVILEKNA